MKKPAKPGTTANASGQYEIVGPRGGRTGISYHLVHHQWSVTVGLQKVLIILKTGSVLVDAAFLTCYNLNINFRNKTKGELNND